MGFKGASGLSKAPLCRVELAPLSSTRIELTRLFESARRVQLGSAEYKLDELSLDLQPQVVWLQRGFINDHDSSGSNQTGSAEFNSRRVGSFV